MRKRKIWKYNYEVLYDKVKNYCKVGMRITKDIEIEEERAKRV